MPTRATCKCCNQSCDNHLLVTCSVCKDRYKHSCVDITANEVRTLNGNKGYDWTCSGCRVIGKDIKDLKSLIIQLQNEIKDLKAENAQNSKKSGFDFEDVVAEVTERQKRRNNIIIFNVDEPDQNKPVADQIQQDKATVKELLQYVVPDMALSDVKPFRLGRHATAKKRPIKVVLQKSDVVRNILKNSSSLKNSRNHRSIVISQDRTMKQIEYYKALKQELVDRKSAGETNLRIKYINDLPKIVPLN
nr:unnamed protein product [Callosobruchus chinensis]